VGKKLSTTFIVIGVILVAAAVVWWAVLAPMLVKLPSDIDTKMDFEGNMSIFLDPTTGASLPAGQEMVVPVTAKRQFVALPDLFTSSTAVFEDTLVLTMMGEAGQPQISRYAMDRKTRKCVASTENWAYSPQIALDRTGNYGPLFPGGLKVGDKVSVFFNDPSKVFEVTVAEKLDNWNDLGISVLKIDATRPVADYNPAIAQAVLVQGQELPAEIAFADLAAQLKASGLDLGALLTALGSVASPEDMQSLGALTAQPVKLTYKQSSADVYYIEQKTGATVGATFDRTTSMSPDISGLLGAFAIIGKYATDPTVGPAIQAITQAATALQSSPPEPTKIFNQNMSIVATGEASQVTLAQSAKDKIPLMTLVKLWIPVIIVAVGALILILGAVGLMMKSRKAAA
jgi:hypothetical protein